MNTNIVISLDTRRAKKDGTYPLMMRLGHNERTTSIPTGISLKSGDWNEKDRKVKSSFGGVSSVTRLNNLLQKQKADAMDIILKLHEVGQLQAMSVTDLRDRIAQKSDSPSFFKYGESVVAELREAGRIGTARSYRCALEVLKKYNKNKDLLFRDLTYSFLTKFEAQHVGKGHSYNGLAVYMRSLRAIFNKAVKAGVVEKEPYPFENYTIRTQPTEKRALEWTFMEKIIATDKIGVEHSCFDTRNYFLASYMMYGMNFRDIAFLRKENLVDGRVHYRRRKKGKLYDIRITPQLDEILSFYLKKYPESEYVFPIIKRDTPMLQDRDARWALKKFNKQLKEVAKICGIETKLTSYVSRHSFATQAMLNEVPLIAISAMLGHSDTKTTEIYLKSLPSNVLDDYNERILKGKKAG